MGNILDNNEEHRIYVRPEHIEYFKKPTVTQNQSAPLYVKRNNLKTDMIDTSDTSNQINKNDQFADRIKPIDVSKIKYTMTSMADIEGMVNEIKILREENRQLNKHLNALRKIMSRLIIWIQKK